MKKILALLLVSILSISLMAPNVVSAAVKMNKGKATLEVDATIKLKLGNLAGNAPTWKSSNSKIASVTKWGTVTAKAEGAATITATYEKKNYTCVITVVDSNKTAEQKPKNEDLNSLVKVVKEYRWDQSSYHMLALVIKNESSSTVHIDAKIKLLDENGKPVGAKNKDDNAVGSGSEVLLLISNEESYKTYECEITAKKDTYFQSVSNNLTIEKAVTDKKVVIEVTNNGTVDAEFVQYTMLYFKDGDVVDYDWGYCIDDDDMIKAGKTELAEANSYKEFDDVKIFLSSRASK